MTTIIDSPGTGLTAEERFEKVRTLVFEDSAEPSRLLASEVAELVRARAKEGKSVVLGLATGSTPVPFYRELIRLHREEGVSFANAVTFNLDEYFGLKPDHPESYHRFMREQLFDHLDIPGENIHIPDGTIPSEQVFAWCQEYERKIEEAGGLDLQILGIGRTGHIGFNEPGSTVDSRTRMITLDRLTRRDAASDFLGEANVPRFAITMGVGTIMKARRVVLMAWGENKAPVLRDAVEGAVSSSIAASYLQDHPAATFVLDRAAASQLTRFRCPWLVRSLEWDAGLTRSAVVWLSGELKKPVLKLVDEDYNENGMSELLTLQGSAYEANIDVFNLIQHTITGWPGGKPNADDTNRPERRVPRSKRVLVFSPEPQDAVVSMGGTLERLVEQGHRVTVACQTSGNLGVADAEARKFASVLHQLSEQSSEWQPQGRYAADLLDSLAGKGEFGTDTERLRELKALILRGEMREACATVGLNPGQVHFLDLPFYEKGRYRRFVLEEDDVAVIERLLRDTKPHQIFATGDVADPSSLQALCFRALREALERVRHLEWSKGCWTWIYRGKEKAFDAGEIDMAVPLSPGQAELKLAACLKFQSVRQDEVETIEQNREIAGVYDRLGLAEYEAIEAFQRWE